MTTVRDASEDERNQFFGGDCGFVAVCPESGIVGGVGWRPKGDDLYAHSMMVLDGYPIVAASLVQALRSFKRDIVFDIDLRSGYTSLMKLAEKGRAVIERLDLRIKA